MNAALSDNTTRRSWEDNAEEFGALVRGEGGWPLAVLVACSVDPNPSTAPKSGITAPKEPHAGAWSSGKVSASEFAKIAGVSQQVISKYLVMWSKAIQAGAPVPPASELSPMDVGTFKLPARPFNGQPTKQHPEGGYVSTMNTGNGSAATQVENIIKGGKLAETVSKSPEAMKALIEAAAKGPKVVQTIFNEIDDKTFEIIGEAYVAATTATPEEITETGVKPAYTPSAAKQKIVYKTAEKVQEAKHKEFVQSLIDNAPPKTNHKPDGHISAHQELIESFIGSDKLWDIEIAIHWLKEMLTAVLAIQGPLTPVDEEYVTEQTGVAVGLLDQIATAVEAKKGSTVPDTVPDSWN